MNNRIHVTDSGRYIFFHAQKYFEAVNGKEMRYFLRAVPANLQRLEEHLDDPFFMRRVWENEPIPGEYRQDSINYSWDQILKHMFSVSDKNYPIYCALLDKDEGSTVKGYFGNKQLIALRKLAVGLVNHLPSNDVVIECVKRIFKLIREDLPYRSDYGRHYEWIGETIVKALSDWLKEVPLSAAEIRHFQSSSRFIGVEVYNILDLHSSIFRYCVNKHEKVMVDARRILTVLEERFGNNYEINLSKFGVCPCCNEFTLLEYTVSTNDNAHVCAACHSAYYRRCAICHKVHHKYQMFEILKPDTKIWNEHNPNQLLEDKDKYICGGCHQAYRTECGVCRSSMWNFEGTVFEYQRRPVNICRKCESKKTEKCTCAVYGCNNKVDVLYRSMLATQNDWYFGGNHSISKKSVLTLCDKHVSMLRPIAPHFLKPAIRHMHFAKNEVQKKDSLLIGFELEFEATQQDIPTLIAQVVRDRYGHNKYTVVQDGSLGLGAEIVSNPLSFMYYKKHRKEYKSMLTMMYRTGAITHSSNIGFHIHASKAAFSPSQIFRLAKLLSKPVEYSILSDLFGRGTGSYNRIATEDNDRLAYVGKHKKNVDDNHYNSFNLSNHTTVEFRMFAGPRHFEDFFAYIECVFALWEWSRTVSNKLCTATNFLRFIRGNQMYPYLARRLARIEGKNIPEPVDAVPDRSDYDVEELDDHVDEYDDDVYDDDDDEMEEDDDF